MRSIKDPLLLLRSKLSEISRKRKDPFQFKKEINYKWKNIISWQKNGYKEAGYSFVAHDQTFTAEIGHKGGENI